MRHGQARGIGYEGLDLGHFVAGLAADGITVVADVRLTPLSRKPGFSKRALAAGLAEAGIAYVHLPSLGNPKWNRAGFGGSDEDRDRAKDAYRDRLASVEARQALADLRVLTRGATVGVLCFEADEERCHRSVVLGAISALATA
jgi:uncharacterized protein (DUF488 family)